MRVRKHIFVTGQVQGVFFRDTCRRVAAEHGVSGWARNTSDGRVEIVLEGESSDVEQVLRWVNEGPPWAAVEGVEVADEKPRDESGFSIH